MDSIFVPCSHCVALNRIAISHFDGRMAICGRCKRDLPLHEGVIETSVRGLEKMVEHNPLPLVVDFWAPWCGPCRRFAPVFSETAGQNVGRYVFVKVNTEADPSAGMRFAVRAIPTLAIFHRGRELNRVSGALTAPQLRDWLSQHAQAA